MSNTASSVRRIILLASCLASAVSLGLITVRVAYAAELTYVFLVWNLFLAWVPLLFSFLTTRSFERKSRVNLGVVLGGLVWLIFFPNAPYMVTDLLHLQARPPVPLWFDVVLLFSFAWTGLFLGFSSLYQMQGLVVRKLGRAAGWSFALVVLGLGSLGVYLGRFKRWNSWDVLFDPKGLAADVLGWLVHPLTHVRTYAVCFLLTVVFMTIYLVLFSLTRLPRQPEAE